MAVLTPASKKALANLRAFTAPQTNYYRLPVTRRAAVLILLFADRRGDLRVVLTIRSTGLKSYAGQAALPGGKADAIHETPFMTARREAFEEIGLPMDDAQLPAGYSVEHLTELPANLAMTELGVRPCVAYLQAPAPTPENRHPDVARDILPKLDAREVAAVFTAPFRNFLFEKDLDPETRRKVPGDWYRGSWHSWHESAWRMHQFHVPVSPSTVFLAKVPTSYAEPRPQNPSISAAQKVAVNAAAAAASTPATVDTSSATATAAAEKPVEPTVPKPPSSTLQPPLPRKYYNRGADALQQPRYMVFGMTARIMVDCARVAYGEEPEYEHNSQFGDEHMIAKLLKIGRLSPVRKPGDVLTREVMMEAAKAKF